MNQSVIDPNLLKILACPESHQPLRLLEITELEHLNNEIASGRIKTASGDVISNIWQAGLIREDKLRAYPIENGLPLLLIESGVELTS